MIHARGHLGRRGEFRAARPVGLAEQVGKLQGRPGGRIVLEGTGWTFSIEGRAELSRFVSALDWKTTSRTGTILRSSSLGAGPSVSTADFPFPDLSSAQHDRVLGFLDEDGGDPPPPETAVPLGSTVGGCEIRSFLGKGGMGEVYLAVRKTDGATVAVKVLRPLLLTSPKLVERFLREARLAAQVRHPNVVAVLDAGSENGTHFHVLELVEGESLAQKLMREKRLPFLAALDAAEQIAAGLGAAHALDIVHRDIKPGNLLLDRAGTVKIADFGLARHLLTPGSLTTKGRRLGTLYFMAPEQVNGDPVDARTDLFALGATLYTMIAGHMPFAGEDPTETLRLLLEKPAPPLSRTVPEVPRAVESLVARLLEKIPSRRPTSAAEVAEAIRDARARPATEAGWRRWLPFGDKP